MQERGEYYARKAFFRTAYERANGDVRGTIGEAERMFRQYHFLRHAAYPNAHKRNELSKVRQAAAGFAANPDPRSAAYLTSLAYIRSPLVKLPATLANNDMFCEEFARACKSLKAASGANLRNVRADGMRTGEILREVEKKVPRDIERALQIRRDIASHIEIYGLPSPSDNETVRKCVEELEDRSDNELDIDEAVEAGKHTRSHQRRHAIDLLCLYASNKDELQVASEYEQLQYVYRNRYRQNEAARKQVADEMGIWRIRDSEAGVWRLALSEAEWNDYVYYDHHLRKLPYYSSICRSRFSQRKLRDMRERNLPKIRQLFSTLNKQRSPCS